MPPSAVVRDEEPTLTTTRDAEATSLRETSHRSSSLGSTVPWRFVVPAEVELVAHLVVELDLAGLGQTSRDVGPGLARAGPERLVDGAAPHRGLALLVEAVVLTAAAEQLGPGVHHRLEVEDDGVVDVTDQDGVALLRTELEQLVLDAEAVEPVGEEADGLVVARSRSARASHHARASPSPVSLTVNSGPPAAVGGRITIRVASTTGLSRRAAATISAMANESSRRPSRLAAETVDLEPRAAKSSRTMSARSRPSGTSTLLSATRRGRSRRRTC